MQIIYDIDKHINSPNLLKQFSYITINSIDEETFKEFQQKYIEAHNSGQQVFPVLIDTNGGETDILASIIALMRMSKIPIMTINTCKANSAGMFLLAFGTVGYRYAFPNSSGFIHEIYSIPESMNTIDVKLEVNNLKKLNYYLFKSLSAYCGQKPKFFYSLLDSYEKRELQLTAKEMKTYKLIDHVKIPTINISVSVDYEIL